MKAKTKALVLALCAVLLVVTTVFATMAFLTDKDSVKNTFTYGQVGISLDESAVNPDGTPIEGVARVQANRYHLIPGHIYMKDPVVHVDPDSEDCWLFVKLNNELKDIIAGPTIEDQMRNNGWRLIDPENNIWAYWVPCEANENIRTFAAFTLTQDAIVSDFGEAVIEVTAYAVQADGFPNAEEAWRATSDNFLANN